MLYLKSGLFRLSLASAYQGAQIHVFVWWREIYALCVGAFFLKDVHKNSALKMDYEFLYQTRDE